MNPASAIKLTRSIGFALLAIICLSGVAQAHPGHGNLKAGETGASATHYVTEPVHAASLLAIAVVGCVCAVYVQRSRRSAVR